MALFQPTNITPSTFSGSAAGTVDVTQDLTVSWQVNGSSPMLAYKIQIMQNDTSSTSVLDTGKTTLVNPFYGVDFKGDVQFFSTTITSAAMSSAGMTNGYSNGYKMVITQWWGATDDESVTQTSASYFITRATPTLTMGAITNPLTGRIATFTATYVQAQGDAIEWAWWQITPSGDANNVLKDTGKIYGTSDLQTSYDGFISGNSYQVKCTVQTINGIEVTTGWQTFSVSYASSSMDENITICPLGNTDAVQISLPQSLYIDAYSVSGSVSYLMDRFGNTQLSLSSVSDHVLWNQANAKPMNFSHPFSILIGGQFVSSTENVFANIALDNGNTLSLKQNANGVFASVGGTSLFSINTAIIGGEYYALIITPTKYYFRIYQYTVYPLVPAEDLYPSDSLYPSDGSGTEFFQNGNIQNSAWQGNINSVHIYGPQKFNYFWIISGAPDDDTIQNALNNYGYNPTFSRGTYFLANFDNNLLAGSLLEANVTGIAIYRQEGDDPIFYHLMDVDITTENVRDYGVVSQKTYQYYFYAMTANAYTSTSITSFTVTPMFWNYTLMCCSQDADGIYHVENEYRFALDVASGSVSNNNTPTMLQNFTRYPLKQFVNANYRSGSLSAYIGKVSQDKYMDSVELMQELYALSTDTRPKFMKNRKGELIRVEVSSPVSIQLGDQYAEQPAKIVLPWAEIGDEEDATIISLQSDAFYTSVDAEGVQEAINCMTSAQSANVKKQIEQILSMGQSLQNVGNEIIDLDNRVTVLESTTFAGTWIGDDTPTDNSNLWVDTDA